jgi:hypothetical protein
VRSLIGISICVILFLGRVPAVYGDYTPAPVVAEEPSMSLGVQGGMAISNFSTDAFPHGTRLGISLGANLEIPLASQWFLQPELMYLQKGVKVDAGWAITNLAFSDVTIRYDVIEIPILMKFKTKVWEGVLFEAFAGPSVGVAMGRTQSATPVGSSISNPPTDISAQYKMLDLGLHLGLGAEFQMSDASAIYLNGRYVLGLNNISNPPGIATTSGPISNRVVLVTVGARFWF